MSQFHASDLLNSYFEGDMTDYLVNFINFQTPNAPSGYGGDSSVAYWPQYSASNPQLMTFDTLDTLYTSTDDYREDAINYLIQLSFLYPL